MIITAVRQFQCKSKVLYIQGTSDDSLRVAVAIPCFLSLEAINEE
jgi:hypothetical protein